MPTSKTCFPLRSLIATQSHELGSPDNHVCQTHAAVSPRGGEKVVRGISWRPRTIPRSVAVSNSILPESTPVTPLQQLTSYHISTLSGLGVRTGVIPRSRPAAPDTFHLEECPTTHSPIIFVATAFLVGTLGRFTQCDQERPTRLPIWNPTSS